ncbi:hypothetical protein BDY21DRAFT_365120 [Lineolata rhizophorae]|uniref:Uncharacterized protein n=1 Tax=Lineolata rhizophorae TaxID=578093 RepID=A0A6A6NWQ4_9PEZI|nr:hypothetical protein BDY21DRAFT_365120 [Lineolata rhizophorae]
MQRSQPARPLSYQSTARPDLRVMPSSPEPPKSSIASTSPLHPHDSGFFESSSSMGNDKRAPQDNDSSSKSQVLGAHHHYSSTSSCHGPLHEDKWNSSNHWENPLEPTSKAAGKKAMRGDNNVAQGSSDNLPTTEMAFSSPSHLYASKAAAGNMKLASPAGHDAADHLDARYFSFVQAFSGSVYFSAKPKS